MPITKEYYLAHHGITGMKWGKRNGPPYPLNYADLSPEEKEHAKKKAIHEGNVAEANANKQHYSDQELRDVITRFELNKKVADLEASTKVNYVKKMEKVADTTLKVSNIIENSSKLYNNLAKIINTGKPEEDRLPMIGEKQKQKKKN